MFNLFKNWRKHHQKTVTILEGVSIAVFFAVVISQFVFLSHIKLALPKLAEVLPSVLVLLTNEERESASLNTLETNELLTIAAQAKANDMANREYFSHVSPEGLTPWFWLDSVGYPYVKAGENLAVNFVDSEDVVEAWLKSPTHKANIVSEKYEEIGIATAQGKYKGKNAIYIVQFFGTQRKSAPVVTPLQESLTFPVATPAPTTAVTVTVESSQQAEEVQTMVKEARVETAPEREILGAELEVQEVDIQEEATAQERALSAPRTIFVAVLLFALLIVALKLSVAIHLRHPRLIAILFTLLVLIAILLYINNSGLYIGDVL